MSKFKSYTLANFNQIPHIQELDEETRFAMEVVGRVLPFRANNYVVEQLIDWQRVPDDPIFKLTFPQREMLLPHHFQSMAAALRRHATTAELNQIAHRIRMALNPHPAGQLHDNVPLLDGRQIEGMQHKYRQTVLFFPSQGQTCHAYCTFCFRWAQFVGLNELKFATRESDTLIAYLREHPEVTDVLVTGGDPMIMKTQVLAAYLEPLMAADLPHLRTIRIGSKALGYWPYRFTSDNDADQLMALFRRITDSGLQLAFMAHFSHPEELSTDAVRKAISRLHAAGAQIRTQSPLLAHINDDPEIWSQMWREQVRLGCVPYYMFVVRDTGAQHYFGIPLARAYDIFREAYKGVSGIARTVRGPSMSSHPGKIEILGIRELAGEKVFMLRMLQGRDPDWVLRPFFARYDPDAIWLDDLKPAFGEERFFFEEESLSAANPVPSGGAVG
ncbi:MAG: lysine 2,3-aminomutase [Acidobacteria bacterium]|nr:lysine 2,3-aminomutase [Acidobacteriota bacterium]